MIAAFQTSTGIMLGTPPAEFSFWQRWGDPRLTYGLTVKPACVGVWNGRDPGLQEVFWSTAFLDARRMLEAPYVPDRAAVKNAWLEFDKIQKATRGLVEAEAMPHQEPTVAGPRGPEPGPGSWVSELGSLWCLPADLWAALETIARFDAPPVPEFRQGRPHEKHADARDRAVVALSAARCPDGRPLTIPELTWLLMLAIPYPFIDEDERTLRDLVQKARPEVVKQARKVSEPPARK